MAAGEERRLGLSGECARILKAIPVDGWVTSREVSKATGLSSRVVGARISSELLYRYVERRRSAEKERGNEYRRLARG